MAEPAVAIVFDQSGRMDCFAAQWGARRELLEAVLAEREPALLFDTDWLPAGAVGPPIVDAVDYLRTEAVYLIDTRRVAVFVPVWAGLPPAVQVPPEAGVLLGVTSRHDIDRLRRQVRRLKRRLCERVADGLSAGDALRAFLDALAPRERYASSQLLWHCACRH